MIAAEVRLWGRMIGAVSMSLERDYAAFQYVPEFANSGIEISPLMMPLSERTYEFPALSQRTFRGLPGLLSDSLPDRFGNALIDAWLANQGRTSESFGAIERLCYTGSRGIGALEYLPVLGPSPRKVKKIRIDKLVELASEILSRRDQMRVKFDGAAKTKALEEILLVGTSAGGARAKALIAWNRNTNEVRSGQIPTGPGFEYWLLKFDGVRGNKDRELEDPQGYGAIEYAYSLMAKEAGITMSQCHLMEENGRRHFMTRRFDRLSGGEKLHMQSLGAMAHFDFNQAGANSYEQAFLVARQLGLSMEDIEEQFRRMVFNVVARNQDDHVKNIAFLMNKTGKWSLAPAFDVTYSYNPSGSWTALHQMTINDKRDEFTLHDFETTAKTALLKRGSAKRILEQVQSAVRRWPDHAEAANVKGHDQMTIQESFRLAIPKK